MCENNYESCLWQYQSEWFALYHTNLSHEVPLSFVWLKFSSFGWDVDMRRIRSDKTLSLGITKAPQGDNQGRSKQLSLGMPRKASPLSSSSIGNFTWGYIFIHHMICVLLGASCMIWVFVFYFTTIILAGHTFWERHTCFGIYYNTLCASLISFELYSFCSSASLISFRARWWICFIETIVLSCFT